jgi:putative SOS response-associated peptidase YedK
VFRGSFRNKRCSVPASAFYERTHVPGVPRKVKYRISRSDGDLVALAGLWDHWHREDQEMLSYTIPTTVPNELMAELHDHMSASLFLA